LREARHERDCAHEGPVIGEGFVIVTGKRNKPKRPIDGWWRVHRCKTCGEQYANPSDLIENIPYPHEKHEEGPRERAA
jgi:hypothetical protein